MGILHKPRMALYWSTDKLLATPIFSQVMRRDRFLLLLRFLHCADNSNYNQNDPCRDILFKVRQVMNMLRRRCSEVFYPGKYLSMDESLVLFIGRLSFKQYIKSKRSRIGIKLFQLCTASGDTTRFPCIPWKYGNWIIRNGRGFPAYRENTSNSYATVSEQGTSCIH